MRTSIGTAAAVALAVGLVATACTDGVGGTTPPAGAPVALGNVKLVAYTSCDDMLEGLREATAKNVGPWGIGGGPIYTATGRQADSLATAEAKSVPSYSTTNVHEAGVDEPDLVKTDGKRIITYAQGVLRVVDAETKKVTGTLRLVPKEQGWAPGNLLVHGDRALVLFSGGGIIPLGAMAKRPAGPAGPQYTLVDLKEMKVLGSITTSGAHVDARMVGSTVRVVVRSQPEITLPEARPNEPEADLTKRNRDAVRAAPIDAWLPAYEVSGPDGKARKEKVPCERVSHPKEYTGTSMLTVHTIDLEAGLGAGEPISVAADGDTVYATPTSMYVASNPRWWFRRMFIDDTPVTDVAPDTAAPAPDTTGTTAPGAASATATPETAASGPAAPGAAPSSSAATVAPKDQPTTPPAEKVEPSNDPSMPSLLPEPTATVTVTATPVPSDTRTGTPTPTVTPSATVQQAPPEQTEVHRFDISGTGAPRYVASGVVPGRLLNQYSLSDYEGNLRVATTSSGDEGMTTDKSTSAVYVLNADTLAKVGQVTGLGNGERIYSVRFIGPVGYVVTFKQVDPLYTLDLRDPARPKVTGELKITGYSAYLHPAGDGRLIGIGQEASEKGRTLGTQVSLFDVSDPAKPARLAQYHQENSGSEAEWDPHAFLYWPATGQAVLPLSSWGERTDDYQTAALVLKVGDGAITKTGVITHPKPSAPSGFAPATPTIQRCLVIGDTLWTVSDTGLKASDATTLADRGWLPFAG
ncbi:beta-propeller domain-containing protein [Sphaerisporangium perillae]|uniref:beta-propeller domain-containing protein n=1 Tax=Sphaerisporangium perillae TaxID=2935860 RepID=UPI00200D2ABD|nr:beta-propeller domain-containing protein [Sphaerisporangium perillae]